MGKYSCGEGAWGVCSWQWHQGERQQRAGCVTRGGDAVEKASWPSPISRSDQNWQALSVRRQAEHDVFIKPRWILFKENTSYSRHCWSNCKQGPGALCSMSWGTRQIWASLSGKQSWGRRCVRARGSGSCGAALAHVFPCTKLVGNKNNPQNAEFLMYSYGCLYHLGVCATNLETYPTTIFSCYCA